MKIQYAENVVIEIDRRYYVRGFFSRRSRKWFLYIPFLLTVGDQKFYLKSRVNFVGDKPLPWMEKNDLLDAVFNHVKENPQILFRNYHPMEAGKF